jgi:hypothetical protein
MYDFRWWANIVTKKVSKPKAVSKTFKATLVREGKPLQWTIVRVPFDVEKVFGSKGMVKVVAEVNGFSYRTSLFPSKNGPHALMVNKKMQKGAGVGPGDSAKFALTLDTEERTVAVPRELERMFKEERALKPYFDSLNYSARHDIEMWITEPKSAEAKERRAEQIAVRLLETMEAERELPPLIKLAFARNPKAADGWEKMTESQRCGQLMAVFYYRTPDSRARRLEKVLQMAEGYAEKKTRISKKSAAGSE